MTKQRKEEGKLELVTPGEDYEEIRNKIRGVNAFLIGVVVVLFVSNIGIAVAIGGLIVDHFREKEATYRDLINKIDAQDRKIDAVLALQDRASKK